MVVYFAKFRGYQLSKIFLAQIGMKMIWIAQISERFPRIIWLIISHPANEEMEWFSMTPFSSIIVSKLMTATMSEELAVCWVPNATKRRLLQDLRWTTLTTQKENSDRTKTLTELQLLLRWRLLSQRGLLRFTLKIWFQKYPTWIWIS